MLKKLSKIIAAISFVLFIVLILVASIRGVYGNPDINALNTPEFRDEGPLELSPERGRFALIYSIVEDNSFQFSLPIAKFVVPDLGYKDGRFVSLFAPGVSFMVIPGYLLGKAFGFSQVGTFSEIALFALINSMLIYGIAKRLGANTTASLIASLTFLFATPAFAYAVTLYQHHITVFLMLASIYVLVRWKGLIPLLLVWILVIGSVVVDYPNFFMFLPIGIYGLTRLFLVEKRTEIIKIKFKFLGVLTFISALIPIAFFLWTNKMSYNVPLQLAGTVQTVKSIDEFGNPLFGSELKTLEELSEEAKLAAMSGKQESKSAVGFFKTRNTLQGFYIHLFSSERGIIFFTPVIFLGLIGIIFLYKKHPDITTLLLSIIGSNILLYSMWGDPWGGWAFGSRYLIPSYALMSIFIAFALTNYSKKIFFILLFLILFSYSVGVNTLGALTTNRVPPKGEAIALEKISNRKEYYTYQRNLEFLLSNRSKSFIYNTFAKDDFTAKEYFYFVAGSIILTAFSQLTFLYITARKEK